MTYKIKQENTLENDTNRMESTIELEVETYEELLEIYEDMTISSSMNITEEHDDKDLH